MVSLERALYVVDETLREQVGHAWKKEVPPILTIFHEGAPIILPMIFSMGKHVYMSASGKAAARYAKGDVIVVMVTEGWGISASSQEEMHAIMEKYKSLANCPDRIELVTVVASDGKNVLGITYDLERDSNGDIFLTNRRAEEEVESTLAEVFFESFRSN